jgi:type IV fimbrial biogenesis protein FimT
MKTRSRGFTVMELAVVLAIAGVIVGIGAPSFNQFRLNNRLTNAANDALAAITRGRSEAIKRQAVVSMCASTDPTADDPECTDGATEGFIAFVDLNSDCVRDADEDLLASTTYEVAFTGTNPLRVRANGNCISFAGSGFRQNIVGRTSVSRVTYCDNRGLALIPGTTFSAGRGISVSPTGRAHITRTTAGSGAANGEGRSDDMSLWNDVGCS